VTSHVAAGEPLHVTFDFERGFHALVIEWAALLEDGREIGRDTHPGCYK
jgi:hypothetical protein